MMTRDCISLFDRRGSPPRSNVATPKPSTVKVPSIARTSKIVRKTVIQRIWTLDACPARDASRWVERLYRRQPVIVPLDLDRRELSGAALRQTRCAGIAGQHIGVAVHAHRVVRGRVLRVVPCAGRELDDTGVQCLAYYRAGKACAALVVEAHDVAIANASRLGVLGVYAHPLAAFDLRGHARRPEIELAVEPRRRLVRDQLQRITRIRMVGGWHPGRMSRAIRIAEPGNPRRGDLDPAARGRQRCRHGVAAELPYEPAIPRQGRQNQLPAVPKFFEIRRLRAALEQRTAGRLVKMMQPLARRPTLGKGVRNAEALGETRKDLVIIPRL